MLLKIRKATSADSEALLDLLEEARKYKISLGDLAWGNYPFTKEDITLRLKSGGCFVAEIDDMIVGSITLIWNDKHNWGARGLDNKAGYVHGLMVRSGFRGQQLGEQMIDWAVNEIRKKGRPSIRLDCRADNAKLCEYYENLGFLRSSVKGDVAFYEHTV